MGLFVVQQARVSSLSRFDQYALNGTTQKGMSYCVLLFMCYGNGNDNDNDNAYALQVF